MYLSTSANLFEELTEKFEKMSDSSNKMKLSRDSQQRRRYPRGWCIFKTISNFKIRNKIRNVKLSHYNATRMELHQKAKFELV